jgi:uncharacterized membrane protein
LQRNEGCKKREHRQRPGKSGVPTWPSANGEPCARTTAKTVNAWDYFSHDQARSRAYRWGEDGLAGISDDQQLLCFAVALWNGKDPIGKERLFGLTNSEGNHGEDVKKYYFYLDSTPTHSYMKYLYKFMSGNCSDCFRLREIRIQNQGIPDAPEISKTNRLGAVVMQMERLSVTIFDSASKTQERAHLLRTLCAEGMIDVYSLAVITKDTYGSVAARQGGDHGRFGAVLGLFFGTLMGSLGGPIGITVGASAGALVGWWVDLKIVGVDIEIVNAVSGYLSPGQSALVTEIDDESVMALQMDTDLMSESANYDRRIES